MGQLNLDLEAIEFDLTLHLNHAQSALTTQQPRHAKLGLIAAAYCAALSKLVVEHAVFDTAHEHRRWQSYVEQSNKLLHTYQHDFEMVLYQSGALVSEIADKKRGASPKLNAEQQTSLIQLTQSIPAGVTKTAWYRQLSEEFGVALSTVFSYAERRE